MDSDEWVPMNMETGISAIEFMMKSQGVDPEAVEPAPPLVTPASSSNQTPSLVRLPNEHYRGIDYRTQRRPTRTVTEDDTSPDDPDGLYSSSLSTVTCPSLANRSDSDHSRSSNTASSSSSNLNELAIRQTPNSSITTAFPSGRYRFTDGSIESPFLTPGRTSSCSVNDQSILEDDWASSSTVNVSPPAVSGLPTKAPSPPRPFIPGIDDEDEGKEIYPRMKKPSLNSEIQDIDVSCIPGLGSPNSSPSQSLVKDVPVDTLNDIDSDAVVTDVVPKDEHNLEVKESRETQETVEEEVEEEQQTSSVTTSDIAAKISPETSLPSLPLQEEIVPPPLEASQIQGILVKEDSKTTLSESSPSGLVVAKKKVSFALKPDVTVCIDGDSQDRKSVLSASFLRAKLRGKRRFSSSSTFVAASGLSQSSNPSVNPPLSSGQPDLTELVIAGQNIPPSTPGKSQQFPGGLKMKIRLGNEPTVTQIGSSSKRMLPTQSLNSSSQCLPQSSSSSATSCKYCLKAARDDPSWDNDYCSPDCVVLHVDRAFGCMFRRHLQEESNRSATNDKVTNSFLGNDDNVFQQQQTTRQPTDGNQSLVPSTSLLDSGESSESLDPSTPSLKTRKKNIKSLADMIVSFFEEDDV